MSLRSSINPFLVFLLFKVSSKVLIAVKPYLHHGALIPISGVYVERFGKMKWHKTLSRTAMYKLKKICRNKNITKVTNIRLIRTLVFVIFV